MNASSFENLGVNIYKAWIIGCSILTFGILTSVYINARSNIQLLHMKRKYKEELKLLAEKFEK